MITLKDEYTVTLGVVALTAYIVHRFLVPPALVHPLLLGRQSHVGQVRKRNESATYNNYGIGSSQLPISPGRGVTTQLSLLKLDSEDASKERWLWDSKITNAQLNARITKMGASLCTAASLVPRGSRVMMLLDASLDWLVADLALAAYCIPTITVASPDLISEVLEVQSPNAIIVQATFLDQLLELLHENTHAPVVIVIGDHAGQVAKWSGKVNLKLMSWEQVSNVSSDFPLLLPTPSDIANAYFYTTDKEGPRGTQFTNQNIVAGANAIINILPTTGPWSEQDTVISAHPLGSPYGKSILYAALYTGASFATLPSANILKEDNIRADVAEVIRAAEHANRSPPTILFLTPACLELLTNSVLTFSKRSLLFWLGWRHKYAALLQGYLSRSSFWDTLIFDGARTQALGRVTSNLRAIVVAEDAIRNTSLLNARIALSVPVVNAYSHPLSSSPVFASHPLDMQLLDPNTAVEGPSVSPLDKGHTGPPSCNIEVKLLKINEEAVATGANPEGELCIRGPGVGDPIPMGVQLDEGWIDAGVIASVRPNGTFVIGARHTD